MSNQQNREIRIEAKTIEAAVVMACVKLGVTQENIEYEVLKQPKSGLMAIFGGKAEIKAWARSGRSDRGGNHHDRHGDRKGAQRGERQQQGQRHQAKQDQGRGDRQDSNQRNGRGQGSNDRQRNGRTDARTQNRGGDRPRHQQASQNRPERLPREERAPQEPLTPESLQALEVEIRDFCKELCQKITGETLSVTSQMSDDKLQLEVDNASIAQMIQEQSKFVESLEHLLRKKPRHLKQDLPFRIFVDAQGSRQGREEEIAKNARDKANQVAETGQKVVMDYKSASDRKIVHMTLENDDRVYTKSIGTGAGRKLLILPSRGNKKPDKTAEDDDTSSDE